jgi:ribose transport system ATP-binding protein
MLHAVDISKTFYGNTVLDKLSLEVADGEVHALLGHNGSGKSTFVKILSGFYEPDAGSGFIDVGGRQLRPGDPRSSAAAGVRVVHQGLGLIGSLTVLENLRLGVGKYETSFGRIRWARERARAANDLSVLGLSISPDARFDSLTAVEQTEVAIARAVQQGDAVRCLILDEPTSALAESEVERLFSVIDALRSNGVSVLYVTHRLGEIHAVASHVSVLRDGELVAQGTVDEFSRGDLLDLIAGTDVAPTPTLRREAGEGDSRGRGREGKAPTPTVPQRGRETVGNTLELKGISTGRLRELTLTIPGGEVLGIVSLVGSGVEEIPKLLRGDLAFSGAITLDGEVMKLQGPHVSQDEGILVVPSGLQEKILESMTVRENLTLGLLHRFWRGFRLDHRKERSFARDVVRRFGIRASHIEVEARTLSGGNRQKLVVARALERRPKVLVLDEPTQGVDVAGKSEILALLHQAADSGMALAICSSDLDEIAEACSRVVVLHEGAVRADLRGSEITRERIIRESHAG